MMSLSRLLPSFRTGISLSLFFAGKHRVIIIRSRSLSSFSPAIAHSTRSLARCFLREKDCRAEDCLLPQLRLSLPRSQREAEAESGRLAPDFPSRLLA